MEVVRLRRRIGDGPTKRSSTADEPEPGQFHAVALAPNGSVRAKLPTVTESTRKPPSETLTFADHPTAAIVIGLFLAMAIGLPGIVDRRDAGTVATAAVALAAILFGVHALGRRTRLAYDAERGVLQITRLRPPLSAKVRDIPLRAVAEVKVESFRRRDFVVLHMGDGERIPLPDLLPPDLSAYELAEKARGWMHASL